jgi:hypothetical protein
VLKRQPGHLFGLLKKLVQKRILCLPRPYVSQYLVLGWYVHKGVLYGYPVILGKRTLSVYRVKVVKKVGSCTPLLLQYNKPCVVYPLFLSLEHHTRKIARGAGSAFWPAWHLQKGSLPSAPIIPRGKGQV